MTKTISKTWQKLVRKNRLFFLVKQRVNTMFEAAGFRMIVRSEPVIGEARKGRSGTV